MNPGLPSDAQTDSCALVAFAKLKAALRKGAARTVTGIG
jgi:hypothetical protein